MAMDIRQIVREASATAYGLAGSDEPPCIVVIASDAAATICESNIKGGNAQLPAILRMLADHIEKAEAEAARQRGPLS